jgi:2-amino-4-hydroxy-6-hydroxymethyldihydropteridine diphosphokinase
MNQFSPAIIVAIGANLPSPDGARPIETCRAAARLIAALPGLRLRALSRWYLTAPVPPSDQPDYVNGAALLEGETTPEALLHELQAIEARFGRQRGVRNAARTLDLDVIDFAGCIRAAPDPVLPHPRAHAREFVLRPLADVAPRWVHPVLGRSVGDLLAALGPPTARLAGQ